jgi:hypothetical protein
MKAKIKKSFIVFSFVLLATLFLVTTSSAGWLYNKEIIKIGASTSGYIIKVQNSGGGGEVQKYLDPTEDKTLLAVALTAQSQGSLVHAYYNTTTNYITELVISNE